MRCWHTYITCWANRSLSKFQVETFQNLKNSTCQIIYAMNNNFLQNSDVLGSEFAIINSAFFHNFIFKWMNLTWIWHAETLFPRVPTYLKWIKFQFYSSSYSYQTTTPSTTIYKGDKMPTTDNLKITNLRRVAF